MQQFPNPVLSELAKCVAFVAGSFAAWVLFMAGLSDVVLERPLFGHTLVWCAAPPPAVVPACKTLPGPTTSLLRAPPPPWPARWPAPLHAGAPRFHRCWGRRRQRRRRRSWPRRRRQRRRRGRDPPAPRAGGRRRWASCWPSAARSSRSRARPSSQSSRCWRWPRTRTTCPATGGGGRTRRRSRPSSRSSSSSRRAP